MIKCHDDDLLGDFFTCLAGWLAGWLVCFIEHNIITKKQYQQKRMNRLLQCLKHDTMGGFIYLHTYIHLLHRNTYCCASTDSVNSSSIIFYWNNMFPHVKQVQHGLNRYACYLQWPCNAMQCCSHRAQTHSIHISYFVTLPPHVSAIRSRHVANHIEASSLLLPARLSFVYLSVCLHFPPDRH